MGPFRAGDNILNALLMKDKKRHLFCLGKMWNVGSHSGNLGLTTFCLMQILFCVKQSADHQFEFILDWLAESCPLYKS